MMIKDYTFPCLLRGRDFFDRLLFTDLKFFSKQNVFKYQGLFRLI